LRTLKAGAKPIYDWYWLVDGPTWIALIVASVLFERVGAKKDYKTLSDGVCWFIRNLDSYLRNGLGQRGQAFWDDAQDVINGLPIARKRSFHKRLLAALKAKIKNTEDVLLAEKLGQYVDQMGG
jgi:hypothetical protein